MATGKLKMWDVERGFGFVGDDSGGPDTRQIRDHYEAAL